MVNQGGKGTLIEGAKKFEEYALAYYNEYSQMSTQEMLDIAAENTRYQEKIDLEIRQNLEYQKPNFKIVLIGASSPSAKYIFPGLLNKNMLNKNELIKICLYDELKNNDLLHDLQSNLFDSAYSALKEVCIIDNLSTDLIDSNQIIILDILPQNYSLINTNELESRTDWLKRRHHFFKILGENISKYCPNTVRILIANNPSINTCLTDKAMPTTFDITALHYATKSFIPPSQIVGLPTSIELRIKSMIANKLNICANNVSNIILWGNVCRQMFVDTSRCSVKGRKEIDAGIVSNEWLSLPLTEVIFDRKWMENDYIMNKAFKEKNDICSKNFGISQGCAIGEYLNKIWSKTFANNEITSLILISEGKTFMFNSKFILSYKFYSVLIIIKLINN